MIVLITGPPGTGKSTLADAAAEEVSAAVFGWDWAMAALTDFIQVQAAFRTMRPERRHAVGWSIVWNLATAQLRAGRSVIVDGVARDDEIAHCRRLASDHATSSLVVETFCSDTTTHRSRVEGRVRDIPGWHELTWQHVESVLGTWSSPADVDLRLDAAKSLEVNRARLQESLHAG